MNPPLDAFPSKGGRRFTLADGAREERWKGDPLWSESWPILLDGEPAGTLFRSDNYGPGRWQASTRALYWRKAADAPIGVGFDVAAFDTAEECLAAWARSADQILDWAEGKPVKTGYGKGVVQKGR